MADQFQFYNCRVRLAGNILNEVPKTGISAAEVLMLANEHGEDAIVDLREASENEVMPVPAALAAEVGRDPSEGWNDALLRAHLEKIFDRRVPKVVSVLGNSLQPLPRFLNVTKSAAPRETTDMDALRADIARQVRAEMEQELARAQAEAEVKKGVEADPTPDGTSEDDAPEQPEDEAGKKRAALEALG